MFPVGSGSFWGYTRFLVGGGAAASPPHDRPRAAAVSGDSGRNPSISQQQQMVQQVYPQQVLNQAASPQSGVGRSSSSVSRGDSSQLLDSAGKRAAIASYPSAGEVLLRHGSSTNMPTFHPRPQPGGVPGSHPAVATAPGTVGAIGNARFIAASSPDTPNLPRGGQYVTVPLKDSTASAMMHGDYYTQNVYPGLMSYQQRPLNQQGRQQRPMVSQRQQTTGQPPLYPAYPLQYTQQRQQQRHQQAREFQQGQQPPRAQPLQRTYYSGSPAVVQRQLPQQRSLSYVTRDTNRADSESHALKSALRSYASTDTLGPSHSSTLKGSPSVRFALDEDELFRKKEGDSEQTSEGEAAFPRPATLKTTSGTVGSEAVVVELPAPTPPAAAGAATSGKELTLSEEKVATEASATPLPSTAALTGASGQETSTADAAVARGMGARNIFASEEVPAAAAGKQLGERAERVAGGVFNATNEQDLVLMYRPLAASEGETTDAAESGKMTATTRPKTPLRNGSSKVYQEDKGYPGLEEGRGKPTSGGKASTSNPQAAEGREKLDSPVQRQAPQESVQEAGHQRAGEQKQQREQPKEEAAQGQQQQPEQGLQQGDGKQQAVQHEHEREEGLKQAVQKEDRVTEQITATLLPCLWVGRGDHPHVCLNFSESFQPKLLVRRSSAPALHIYVNEQLPVKDYFLVASPPAPRATTAEGAVDATRPTLAPLAVEEAALTAAATQGSKARPTVATVPQEAKGTGKIEANKITEDAAAGGLTAAGGDALPADVPAEGAKQTGERETHALSRRDWSILNSFFSFSPSAPRSPSAVLRLGSLPFELPEKGEPVHGRRASTVSTSDVLSADEMEWRLEMARPTILFHQLFQNREKQQEGLPAAGGFARGTEAAAAKSQRILIVVDTTTEWWPSVQVRWLDGKKTLHDLHQQQQDQQEGKRPSEAVESTQAETQEAENERLIHKGHPTNFAGICIWSAHPPTLLDRRF